MICTTRQKGIVDDILVMVLDKTMKELTEQGECEHETITAVNEMPMTLKKCKKCNEITELHYKVRSIR